MILKLTLLVTIVALAQCKSRIMLGAEKCTWGPAYWCENREQAEECHSTQHCETKVWIGNHPLAPQPPPQPDNGGNCAVCELLGGEILEKLKNNATEEEVLESLEGLCDFMPSSKAETCKAFLDKWGHQFYEEFIKDASVKQICQWLGLCSEEFLSIMREGNVAAAYISGKPQDIGCDTCQSAVGLVQKEVLANEKQLESMVDQVCSVLPISTDECTGVVNSIFEAAVTYFESYTAEELCQMMGLCDSAYGNMLGVGPVQLDEEAMPKLEQKKKPLLGKDDDCLNGPAYWCASDVNIKKCNAEEYCSKQGSATVF